MVHALRQTVTFDEFIEWYPENSGLRYELHRGVIVEMPKPKGKHSLLATDLIVNLSFAIRQAGFSYAIPKECVVRSADGESGYEPDVIVLDRQALEDEPRWEKASVIEKGTSVRLAIEIVSTNWRDDYFVKYAAYEELGIAEYWIADYAALGGRRFIGNPKQPTISVCQLVDGEYEIRQFRGSDPCGICEAARIISAIFPNLELTVEQVFAAA